MKKDLISAFLVAVLGVGIAYFVTGMFVSNPEAVRIRTVDASSLSADLAEPDDKVFNYLAINPTVEVYVGGCESYDINGDCMDDSYRAQLLQQQKTKQKDSLGYYDEDGYFHNYEYDEEGFYDINGDYFEFVDDGYRNEDGDYFRFDSTKKGYYDGAEYKNVNNGNDEDEEEDDGEDEEEEENDLILLDNNGRKTNSRTNSRYSDDEDF